MLALITCLTVCLATVLLVRRWAAGRGLLLKSAPGALADSERAEEADAVKGVKPLRPAPPPPDLPTLHQALTPR